MVATGDELATSIMTRLRRWFLAPTASMLAVLFFAPMAIILAYSFLMRGAYGGVTDEWTIENYARLFDPLYGSDPAAHARALRASDAFVPHARVSAGVLYLAVRKTQELVPSACDDPVLDQLPRPHVCVDVPAAGYGPDQLRI